MEVPMVVHDVSTRPAREQFDYWREVICREFTPLTPSRGELGASFSGRVELKALGDVSRARLGSEPQHVAHGDAEVSAIDEPTYFVNVQVKGLCYVRTDRGESVVRPGQLTVVDTTRRYWFDFDAPWQLLSYRVPHRCVERLGSRALDNIGRAVDSCSGTGLVLTSVMQSLWNVEESGHDATDGSSHLTAVYVAAMLAALGTGVASADRLSPLKVAAVEYARSHLSDSSLSVTTVSRALSVSPRTLHYAFAGGAAFSQTVRGMRLEAVAEKLRDRSVTASLTQLASAHGMVDHTAFGRAFKQRYSMSPRDYRALYREPSAAVRLL
jgi:AraC family transcriptional regulator, positive regulator of tynA and feaB